MQIAVLGLGKMGGGIAGKLMEEGHEVVAWNRSREVLDQLRTDKADYIVKGKLQLAHSIEELREKLLRPRVFWLMLPAGEATEGILLDVASIAEGGDIVVDGGNSNYKDTQRHYDEMIAKGIKFLGIGVSGGIHGLEDGFCLMSGGDRGAYDYLCPAFDSLVKPSLEGRPGGAYGYFGTGGAGHFVKMVHNGIEYGMMQALGEGYGVLAKSEYGLSLPDISAVWQRGSIVRSFLLDMAIQALREDPVLANTEGLINSTGEGKWTIEAGKELGVPVGVIEQSLAFREKSQYDEVTQNTFAAKMVAALRKEFGGHAVKKKS